MFSLLFGAMVDCLCVVFPLIRLILRFSFVNNIEVHKYISKTNMAVTFINLTYSENPYTRSYSFRKY